MMYFFFYCVWKWKRSKGNICTAACGWGDYKYLESSVSECKCSTPKSARDLLQIYPFSNRYLSTWNWWQCTINYPNNKKKPQQICRKRLSAFSENTVLASCHFWGKKHFVPSGVFGTGLISYPYDTDIFFQKNWVSEQNLTTKTDGLFSFPVFTDSVETH